MSKKIHTIQSSDKKQFDKQINQLLELGCELHDNGYEVIKKDNDIIYSQVIVSENCELKFFNDGQLEYFSQLNKDGKIDGKWTSWNENGQKVFEENFKDGEKDGLHTEWYWNGQKKIEASFKGGKKMDYGLNGMRMERRNQKIIIRTDLVNVLFGLRMDGRKKKVLTRMGKKLVNGLLTTTKMVQ